MKKVILGSALMICGVIAACTEYLKHAIYFAAPSIAVIGKNYLLSWGGVIVIIIGIILCVMGLTEKYDDKEE